MPWVRRQSDQTEEHVCDLPRKGWRGSPPPEADIGDLWRCGDCGTLWRVGLDCDACDRWGTHPHGGMHTTGYAWRPATLWQCFRHRGDGRTELSSNWPPEPDSAPYSASADLPPMLSTPPIPPPSTPTTEDQKRKDSHD